LGGQRISEADAIRLFESKDLNAVGAIADFVNQRKNQSRASYIINRIINYSNYLHSELPVLLVLPAKNATRTASN